MQTARRPITPDDHLTGCTILTPLTPNSARLLPWSLGPLVPAFLLPTGYSLLPAFSHEPQRIHVHNQIAPRHTCLRRVRHHAAQRLIQSPARCAFQDHVKAVDALDARDRRGTRPQHAHSSAVFVLDKIFA